MKQYTFAQVAKMECAECTTPITTTVERRYVLAADHERALSALHEENERLRVALKRKEKP